MLQHLHKPTLFLDRDGVLNTRIPFEYIARVSDWQPVPGLGQAMQVLAGLAGRMVVVTNQAGVGKGLMAMADVDAVHRHMEGVVRDAGGRIDRVYTCPHLKEDNCGCRKPATGMAYQAKSDFPDIVFQNSIMVGDSLSDMQFGWALGMVTVLIEGKTEEADLLQSARVDLRFPGLPDFAAYWSRLGK